MPGECTELGTKCHGNAGECQGNEREWVQSAKEILGKTGIPGECMGVGAKCQGNAGVCQGNVREWAQCASGMQWNAG